MYALYGLRHDDGKHRRTYAIVCSNSLTEEPLIGETQGGRKPPDGTFPSLRQYKIVSYLT